MDFWYEMLLLIVKFPLFKVFIIYCKYGYTISFSFYGISEFISQLFGLYQ